MASLINLLVVSLCFFSPSLSSPTPHPEQQNSPSRRQDASNTSSPYDSLPFQMYNILSTPSTITFLMEDPNPGSPTPDGGLGTPIQCTATLTSADGTVDIPSDRQTCIDSATGKAESNGTFSWFITGYDNPGLFNVTLWHSYMIDGVGPCAVQPDGTLTYCEADFIGEHQVDARTGEMICDDKVQQCASSSVIEVPIIGVVA